MKNLASLITKRNVVSALEKALVEKPYLRKATKFHLKYKDEFFPPKEVVRLAAIEKGIKEVEFNNYRLNGGPPTNDHLIKMGFEIVPFAEWKTSHTKITKKRSFTFEPGKSLKSLNIKVFKTEQRTVQSFPLHDKIQDMLYNHLVREYGKNKVGMETNTGSNTRIDIAVESKQGINLYEIKSFDEAIISIRNAVGQLLEYAFYPNPIKKLNELIIVSHLPLSKNDKEYMQILRHKLNLKLYYQFVDIKKKIVSAKF